MAEAVVSFVISRLADQALATVFSKYGVSDKIKSLKEEHNMITSALKDANKHGKGDEMERLWLKELRDLSYDIEDVIERFLMEIKGGSQIDGGFMNHLMKISRILTKLTIQEKIEKDISMIEKRLRDLFESRKIYTVSHLAEPDRAEEATLPIRRPLRSGHEIRGFKVLEREIIEHLLGINDDSFVVSIVGPGGIGKTALAHKIVNSDVIERHFNLIKWMSLSELREYKKSELINGRHLIILDHVRINDSWKELVNELPCWNGSRILMTTRFSDVAMNKNVHLHFLSDEESRMLLLKEVFPSQSSLENYAKSLGDVPMRLAKRCGGLPLALSVVGRLLSKKPPTIGAWDMVLKTLDWHSDGKECIDILRTSYAELPDYLKFCFMYFACFRKDQEIQAKRLIQMWIAEGFLPEVFNETTGAIVQTSEEKANTCLEDLAKRCLIQVTKRYTNGKIKSCRIHDLFRELAIGEAKESNFLLVYKSDTLVRDLKVARRVAFHYEADGFNTFEENMLEETFMPNVRSFFVSELYVPIGKKLKFLKVLEFRGTKDLKVIPEELMHIIYLRYIGLRSTGVNKIPKTIGKLLNLQTLDVRDTCIESLPDSLWRIKPLRHVHVSDRLDQVEGPPPSANLENIQSLKMVRVRKAWRFRGLPLLPLIRNLGLSCHRITDEPDAQPDLDLVTNLLASLENLVSLVIRGPSIPNELIPKTSPSYQNIKSLFLCGSGRSPLNLDGFQIPPNLIKLTLQLFILNKDPMPILEKLGDLKTLCLKWLTVPPKMICSAGSFSQLERFEMVFLSGLEEWSIVGAMPMLNKLLIGSCSKLNALPDLKNLNKLHEFTLSYPSQKLKEMIIKNPTYNAPNSFQWNKCGSAEFRLSAMS